MRAALLIVLALLALVAGCGGSGSSAAGCEDVEAPAPRDPGTHQAPPGPLDPGMTYTLTFETNCGSFTVTLDPQLAPRTAPSLAALAQDGYFDDTIFHRVVPDFVIQGGDPTQVGDGGPGYSTIDVPPADTKYTKGLVAMAKAPDEPPGTAGSQFFVMTADAPQLTPDYAVVGRVTDGMDTVDRINALGVGDGPPAQPVVVKTVTVTES